MFVYCTVYVHCTIHYRIKYINLLEIRNKYETAGNPINAV